MSCKKCEETAWREAELVERINALLEANNAEVARRRAAEAKLEDMKGALRALAKE